MYPVRRQVSRHAAQLRRDRTWAEDRLWQAVRNRQLEGFKFRFQCSMLPYVADFLCHEAKLIVEVDGGQHCDKVDAARTAFFGSHGYRVIRFWNNDVIDNLDGVIAEIRAELIAAVERRKTLTLPSPAKAGEGF